MTTPQKTNQKQTAKSRVIKKDSSVQAVEERDQLAQLTAAHRAAAGFEHPSPADIVSMQKTVGNLAVQRYLDHISHSNENDDQVGLPIREEPPVPASGDDSYPTHSGNGKHEAAKGVEDEDKVKKEAAKGVEDEDKVKKEAAVKSESDQGVRATTPINWQAPSVSYVSAALSRQDEAKSEDVSWSAASYSSSGGDGSSTCVEKPFRLTYTDAATDTDWKIKVGSVSGGATIKVETGGSTNAITSPPGTEEKAKEAVTDMKGYYARGYRGDWHTEAASKKHEKYHYKEWKTTCNHYWPTCQEAIEKLKVAKSAEPNQGTARATLETKANNIVKKFKDVSWDYWMTLGDKGGDRPYAAGQLKLNDAVESVQELAEDNEWTVPEGTASPSTANPCYKGWKPFNP